MKIEIPETTREFSIKLEKPKISLIEALVRIKEECVSNHECVDCPLCNMYDEGICLVEQPPNEWNLSKKDHD